MEGGWRANYLQEMADCVYSGLITEMRVVAHAFVDPVCLLDSPVLGNRSQPGANLATCQKGHILATCQRATVLRQTHSTKNTTRQ